MAHLVGQLATIQEVRGSVPSPGQNILSNKLDIILKNIDSPQESCSSLTHQASSEFKDPGRQCIFNSIASFIFNEGKNVQTWLPKDLDQLLKHGDWLSVNYGRRVECPLISKIPNTVWLNERQHEIKIGSSGYSSFESADFPFDVHRLEHLLKKYMYFIITIGNSNPAYSCAIIFGDNELCYVFDPHGRNEKGLADPCGRATLTTHHKDQLENFFKNLARSLSASVFEITSVALAPIFNASILEETSAPSDATDILTCYESDTLFLASR
ncbi:hypothetical protein PoB_005940600 [Plakobranchus ocellatus]|uniref:Peptidase C76 domain-containing protein n=1 Tax=Plakobranchus ocellatus TaxID=259542 RepID=A0AAV4CJ47_9GAST|nr:hypothetical protein PoB_005940600 [Plakobranchus ocellatus]